MKTTYQTVCDRSALAQYLAWEFGTKLAVEKLKAAKPFGRGRFVVPSLFSFGSADGRNHKLRRDAVGLSKRVADAAAWSDGKRNVELRDHLIEVITLN